MTDNCSQSCFSVPILKLEACQGQGKYDVDVEGNVDTTNVYKYEADDYEYKVGGGETAAGSSYRESHWDLFTAWRLE